jgi:hypothetical protein
MMSEKQETPVVANSDDAHPQPLLSRSLIRHLGDIEGESAEEIPVFVPTRHELRLLAWYWHERYLDIAFDVFLIDQISRREKALESFCLKKLDCIAALLGDEEATQIAGQVRASFAKSVNPRHWEVFLTGDEKQREKVQEEILNQITEESEEAAT